MAGGPASLVRPLEGEMRELSLEGLHAGRDGTPILVFLSNFSGALYALDGDTLWAWPMAREFSIRPLIFKQFKRQGIAVSDYQRDGEKYYFSQKSNKLRGAQLKYICFVELSGEADSMQSSRHLAHNPRRVCRRQIPFRL